MNVGFYHDNIGTKHAGGISVYARKLALELSAAHDVYVYTQDGDVVSELAESDVHVVETPSFDPPALDGRFSSKLASLLPVGPQDLSKLAMISWSVRNDVLEHIETHVDVLVTFQFPDDLLLSNLVDVPTVYGYLSDGSMGTGAAIRERYTQTDAHFAISPYLADRVADAFGHTVDEIVLPGLEVDRFHPDVEPAFASEEPTVLFVGRVVESKGVFDLLEAVGSLEDDVHLRIVGTGHAEAAVRQRSRALGIADDVTLEGEVPHHELPGYYAGADVFCLPTHVDSFAMVNLEAMGCGTPVLTTDLEGIKTYLVPEENGVVVPPGEPDALARALEDLLSDPDRRRVLGSRARRRACEFSWRQQAGRLERLCADVLGAELEIDPSEAGDRRDERSDRRQAPIQELD